MSSSADPGALIRLERPPEGYSYRTREQRDDLLDLRELWTRFRSQSRLAASIFSTTMLAALLYLLIAPPTYTAISVIHVDPRQQRVIKSETVLSGIGADSAAVESQIELIRSTTAARKVIEQLKLLDDPEFSRPSLIELIIAAVAPNWNYEDPSVAARQHRNKVIARFHEHLSVRRRGLTYIIEVGFDSVDAEKAALIANALADTYLDGQMATKSDAATSASNWLTERIDKLRDRVRDSERAVADYKADNNIIDIGTANSGLTLINRQIEQSNQQLILARSRAAEANAKYNQVKRITEKNFDPGSLTDALKSDVISRLRVQYSSIARVESEYSAVYGPSHPSLKRIRSQLATMRQEIDQELDRILTSSKNEYEIASARIATLAASLKALEQKSLQFNQANVRLGALQREARANRELFEQFLSRAKETNEQSSLKNSDARIVARAIVPVEPSWPQKMIVLLIAAVGGMGLSVGSALLRQHFDRSYRRKSDLERDTGVSCLGLCPAVNPRDVGVSACSRTKSWLRLPRLVSGPAAGDAIENKAGFRQLVSRMVLDQPGSSYAEAIRSIQLVCEEVEPGPEPKTLLVSSALPGEGKSTLAANLARSLAKSGAYTLLIDADSRAGSLSEMLNCKDALGLSDVLSNRKTFRETVICEPASTMFFLPAGRSHMSLTNTDILADDRFQQFLGKYRDSFDHIVIDGPPVLSAGDGRTLYQYADAALFLVEWGKTDDQAVIAAMEALGSMHGKIAGSILNKVDPNTSDIHNYKY